MDWETQTKQSIVHLFRFLEGAPALASNLRDWTGGFPAGSGDGISVASSGISDSTASLAIARQTNGEDFASGTIRQVEQLLAEIQSRAKLLEQILKSNQPVDRSLAGCQSCAAYKGADGDKIYTPVYRRSDVGGRLPEKIELCRSCYDWVIAKGSLPNKEIVLTKALARSAKGT